MHPVLMSFPPFPKSERPSKSRPWHPLKCDHECTFPPWDGWHASVIPPPKSKGSKKLSALTVQIGICAQSAFLSVPQLHQRYIHTTTAPSVLFLIVPFLQNKDKHDVFRPCLHPVYHCQGIMSSTVIV